MTLEELRGLVAKGWTTKENEEKVMDAELAEAIVQILWTEVFTNGGG